MIKVKIDRDDITLAELAAKYYGNAAMREFLWRWNQAAFDKLTLGMSDFLPINLIIEIPDNFPDVPRSRSGTESVLADETLKSFAKRVYGVSGFEYRIIEANTTDANEGYDLYEGLQLFVPAIAKKSLYDRAVDAHDALGSLWRKHEEVD